MHLILVQLSVLLDMRIAGVREKRVSTGSIFIDFLVRLIFTSFIKNAADRESEGWIYPRKMCHRGSKAAELKALVNLVPISDEL
jgi:hypothetical protein